MNDQESELAKQAQHLGKTTTRDHVANIVKAAFNAVPIVGGSIASLIDDYIPQSRQKRIEEFSKSVVEKLERVSARLDESYVKTDEFAYLFTRVYQNVSRDYQKEKLDAYRNILVNALQVHVDASVQERYLGLVEQLTPMHLRVLSAFVSDATNHEQLEKVPSHALGTLNSTLMGLLPELSSEHIESCIFDLDQMGITNQVKAALRGMMSDHSSRKLEGRVTAFGRGFLDFISKP